METPTAIDEDNLTLEFSFSSNVPIERFYGYEVLEHTAGAIDGSRLDAGAPILVIHSRGLLVGVVDAWRIDEAAGKCYVTARFSPHQDFARQIFLEVKDGIRTGISFGYNIIDFLEEKQDDRFTLRATKWQPYEISIEATPADISVGFGRSLEGEDEEIETPATQETPNPVEQQAADEAPDAEPIAETPVTPAENTEVRNMDKALELMEFARAIGEEALGKEFVVNGRSIEELKEAVKASMAAAGARTDVAPGQEVNGGPDTEIGMSRKETEKYSVCRALLAAIDKDWSKAGIELEAHRAVAEKLKREADNGGFFVPYEAQTRNLSAGVNADGGFLVGTEHRAESFIDLLRNKSVMMQLGAQRLTGLRGDIAIPKQTGAATAYWVAEGQAPTKTKQQFSQIGMSPKTLGAITEFTRKLLMQSNPSVERLVYNDLAKVMALGIDSSLISGSGTGDEPRGIMNATGVQAGGGTGAAGITTWADIVGYEGMLEEANIELSGIAFLSRPSTRALFKARQKVSGQAVFLTSEGNTTNGYNHAATMQTPASSLIFGDFSQIVVGEWGVLELVPNPYGSGFAAGNIEIRALQSIDAIVRYGSAFVVDDDVS